MTSLEDHVAPVEVPPPARVQTDRLVGRVFNNRFRIHSLIARGGMGKVYRAVQVPLGRVVALKVLHPAYTEEQNADFHRRFFLEAAIAAQLSHPHTVTVFDFGQTEDGIYYLAMEFLQGTCLRRTLREAQVFSPHRALSIAIQVAQALAEAHRLGAIHRDLKPANIYLLQRGSDSDFVKVLDFGLVKSVAANDDGSQATQPGKFLGSPGYMAPEQIRGRPLDGRCDVYALGVLLYEMLCGRPPFVCSNAMETMMAHVHDAVPPLRVANPHIQIPPQLEQLVQTCLRKDRAQRYASMDALVAALTELLGGESPVTLVTRAPTTASAGAPRLPMRLDDEEKSGWSVVSTTGVLALPRPVEANPSGWSCDTVGEVQTVLGDTLAMDAPAPPAAAAVPAARAPERPPVPGPGRLVRRLLWGAALGSLVALTAVLGLAQQRRQARGPVTVTLTSTPAGAQARVGDQVLCAATPCVVRLPQSQSQGRFVVHFRLAGHDEFVASRRLAGRPLRIDARLGPAQRAAAPPRATSGRD